MRLSVRTFGQHVHTLPRQLRPNSNNQPTTHNPISTQRHQMNTSEMQILPSPSKAFTFINQVSPTSFIRENNGKSESLHRFEADVFLLQPFMIQFFLTRLKKKKTPFVLTRPLQKPVRRSAQLHSPCMR